MTNSNAQKDARCHFENSLWHDGRGISIVQAVTNPFVRLRTFASFQQKSPAALLPHMSIYHVYTVHTISPTDNFNSEFQP